MTEQEKMSLSKRWNPEDKLWEKPNLKPSEILAGALEFWGQGGERWIRNSMGYNLDKGCLLGGMCAALYGSAAPSPFQFVAKSPLFEKACDYVRAELAKRGIPQDIVYFNDTFTNDKHPSSKVEGFKLVHAVVCCALKQALADEEAGTTLSSNNNEGQECKP